VGYRELVRLISNPLHARNIYVGFYNFGDKKETIFLILLFYFIDFGEPVDT
jgi:hypothetical protein